VTIKSPGKESTVSIRLVWPFARVARVGPDSVERLARVGLEPEDFANPDTRLPHAVVMRSLEETVANTGDPTIGLRAGEQLDAVDFDVLENAARCSPTLGDAMACMARYMRLMNDAAEITLHAEGEIAEWRFRVTDGVPQPPAANDFVITAALQFSKRNASVIEPPLEVRLMHAEPSYAAEYEKSFGVPVRFNAPFNTVVIRRARLAVPMSRANPRMSDAFQIHARQLLDKLRQGDGVAGRVREEIAVQLGTGAVSMHATAKRLAMSVATLRRRLEEEGETFAGIVDDLRKRLAERYLNEQRLTINEVAFLLGFASAAAFNRAFKRWTGMPPAAYRKGRLLRLQA
jgi:AraC-like DNA-binding protein